MPTCIILLSLAESMGIVRYVRTLTAQQKNKSTSCGDLCCVVCGHSKVCRLHDSRALYTISVSVGYVTIIGTRSLLEMLY